jgi:hypothetical protein
MSAPTALLISTAEMSRTRRLPSCLNQSLPDLDIPKRFSQTKSCSRYFHPVTPDC